ncbi:MAG: hydrolase [Bacteroides sp.]|jgi:hypothetical protein|nr:hydrolase [Bacteroides sp.]
MTTEHQEPECCPPFDPAPWMGTVHEWHDKIFIREKVRTFLYMPLNFGGVMRKAMSMIEIAGAKNPDYMVLSEHTSRWNMDVYLAVDREIPKADNFTLSGRYLSQVYEGPFRDTGKWMEDFKKFATEKELKTGKSYMWYTTCPKCAKKYGKNYVVVIGEVV